jgi:hypothetical protein
MLPLQSCMHSTVNTIGIPLAPTQAFSPSKHIHMHSSTHATQSQPRSHSSRKQQTFMHTHNIPHMIKLPSCAPHIVYGATNRTPPIRYAGSCHLPNPKWCIPADLDQLEWNAHNAHNHTRGALLATARWQRRGVAGRASQFSHAKEHRLQRQPQRRRLHLRQQMTRHRSRDL